ncbi:hypothetical protein [uncultured Mucilaginibacter sp.]|uniref:hypothetical protein n=1 Tax=uncultured Mucilaginibacter sp. TaxID=797541 RepID=UPI0025F81B93|nr:hypothetical protein [uncultured Mucilaginibacter sp.]
MPAASILDYSSTISGVLPVLAWLYNHKNLDKGLKIAGIFFLVAFFVDILLELMTTMGVVNNMPLIHLFIVINILFFTAIYYNAFFKPSVKKAIIALAGLALLIVVFNIIFVEGIWEYPSLSITVLSVLLICFSLAYFYQLLNRQEFIHIEKQGLFWINSGVLFYFAINIFLFMLFKHFSKDEKQEYYMIHSTSNTIANILYTVGLLCKPQKIT